MRIRNFAVLAVAVLALSACADATAPTERDTLLKPTVASAGFDDFGYNDVANVFVGVADGVDKVIDGKVWGDPTYTNDQLVMKWNLAWEKCNAVRNDANCAGAWTSNEWNGMVPNGSGETWHYKIVWWSDCKYNNTAPDGGYCIWDEYAVLMSQGTGNNTHIWDALAKPAGYGSGN